MGSDDPDVLLSTREDEGVAVLTLNRPERLNALSYQLHRRLQEELASARCEAAVRAIVVTGSGRAFCAGGDVREMAARPFRRNLEPAERDSERNRERARLQHVHQTIKAIAALRKPVVAALNGPTAGSGLAMALACEAQVAAESATLSVGFTRIALPGDSGISALLEALLPTSQARRALTHGSTWSSSEAASLGLVDIVVPDDQLRQAAMGLALRLAAAPSVASRAIRTLLLPPRDLAAAMESEIEATLDCQETEDHEEAIAAFLERRAPVFVGR